MDPITHVVVWIDQFQIYKQDLLLLRLQTMGEIKQGFHLILMVHS